MTRNAFHVSLHGFTLWYRDRVHGEGDKIIIIVLAIVAFLGLLGWPINPTIPLHAYTTLLYATQLKFGDQDKPQKILQTIHSETCAESSASPKYYFKHILRW